MKDFWENSPEWQRKEELYAALKAVELVEKRAADWVLACVLHDAVAPDGEHWRERRQAYQDAHAERRVAFDAWMAADRAFYASPAGQAYARYWKDPLAGTATESEAA